MRAQANLVALAVALLLLTGATVVAVSAADDALVAADGDPAERRAANAVADGLVAADAQTTDRANVLNASRVDGLDADALAPPAAGHAVRVRLDGATLVERGTVRGGTTVRRAVLVVSRPETVRLTVDIDNRSTVRRPIPRGVGRATVDVLPGPNTTIPTVRANDRVVMHADAGLNGERAVALYRHEPTTVRVDGARNATGMVVVTYRPPTVEERILEVTVDA
jgi:hypothetical protein